MKKTLYDLLEVSRTAGKEAIDSSYRRLAESAGKLADNGDADAGNKLKALREAYFILSDAQRRAGYDVSLSDSTVATQPQVRVDVNLAHGDGLDEESRSKRWLITGAVAVVLGLGAMYLYTKSEREKQERALALERERVELQRQTLEAARESDEDRRRMQQEQSDRSTARQQQLDAERQRIADQQYFDRQKREEEAAQRRQQLEKQQQDRAASLKHSRDYYQSTRSYRLTQDELRRMCIQRVGRPDC